MEHPKGDKNQIVRWANAIANATSNVSYNAEAAEIGWDHDMFGPMANALVDGAMAELDPYLSDPDCDAYGEFIENNSENWYHWISQTIGNDWGKVAKIIHEQGY